MIVIDRKARWILELAWLGALLSELGHERELIVAREYLYSMILAISDEQETSMMVEPQASREVEQAISVAFLLGADREQLDSRSITINRIVSHPLRLNHSHDGGSDERDTDATKQPSNKKMNEGTKNTTTHSSTQRSHERASCS